VKPARLRAMIRLLQKRGAADRSPKEAGLDDADCLDLADVLRAGLPVQGEAKASATPLPKGRAELYCDGASRGNPGPAALGFVILLDGTEVAAEGLALGKMTNNQAEYRALRTGLDALLRLGLNEVDIAMDSELVVRQVQGRYKVRNAALKPLFEEVIGQLGTLDSWSIRHIPRAENARADALANRALDSL